MPLKPNFPGIVWSYLTNKLRYPFSFREHVTELSEPNLVYGLTDHPLDQNNSPIGGVFGVVSKLFGKTSYSIQEVRLKTRNDNTFEFEGIGYNIFLKKKMPDGVREMYPLPQFPTKPQQVIFRIQFLQPGMYRVMCILGKGKVGDNKPNEIPAHQTEMLEKDLTKFNDNPGFTVELREEENVYHLTTTELKLQIFKTDFRIRVYNKEGKFVTESSGYSKNQFPSSTDSLPLGFVKIRKNKKLYGTESFVLSPGEAIYGLGEHYSSFNRVGQTIALWNWEGYGNSSGRAYKNIPLFLSTRGYGIFVNESRPITFWIGSREFNKIFIAIESPLIDYFFLHGPSLKEVLFKYTDLTGRSPMPPKWTFGMWMSRISYKSQAEVLEVAHRLRNEKFPCDVICIDTEWFTNDWHCDWKFAKARFPDPVAMCQELHNLGFKLSLWQAPYVMSDLPEYRDVKKHHLGAKNHGPFIFLTNPAVALDFSNPEAVKWYQDKLQNLFEIGANVIKIDFGEQIENHMQFQKYCGREMHNLYAMLYQRAAFEITKRYFGQGFIWARSAYAGSQRYPVHWSGDSSCSFEEMLNVLRGGLSLGMCGFSYWSQDVGGFMFSPSDKLYIRWSQFGIFNSHMRYHGSPPRYREPWNYESGTQDLIRDLLNLRYRMFPYIYTESHYCSETGLPMLRALVLEYEKDPTVYNIEDQYLFGRNLLIAPILTEDDERKIYFPEGEWVDYWSLKRYSGKIWIDYACDLDKIPVFIKAGTMLPFGPVMQNIPDQSLDSLSLLVIPDSHNHIEPYELFDTKIGRIEAHITDHRLSITIADPIPSLQLRVEIPEQHGIQAIEVNGRTIPIENAINGKITSKSISF
jgi:alpha-D-xyloside xylohydrolase